jgi:hypothetical protein
LVRICPPLSGNGIGLVRRVSCIDVTILKNNCSVAKYEVNSAINVTFSIELSLRMDIEGVLVSFEAALVEHR